MIKQTQIKAFIAEVNQELSPVLEIIMNYEMKFLNFRLQLCETKYAMRDQVVIDWDNEFVYLIEKLCNKHFGVEPNFNNTGSTFWFFDEEGYER